MARGATNQKGPERAFLNAVESILKTKRTLPVNLIVAAEGEEELGSPNYPQVVEKYEARLKQADGVFFPLNAQDSTGGVSLPLGVKGVLSIELEATGGPHGGPTRAEIHSSLKAVVDAPRGGSRRRWPHSRRLTAIPFTKPWPPTWALQFYRNVAHLNSAIRASQFVRVAFHAHL